DNEPDKDVKEQLKWIYRLEINVSYPFLLEVYNDFTDQVINKETFLEVLETLQSFVWRRFIVGLPTNALNKIFMRIYEDIDRSQYLTSFQYSLLKRKGKQRFPNDQEVINILKEKDMYNIQNKNRTYFLERLENYQNPEKVQIENNPAITIEHIFPQNPDSKWKIILGEAEYELMKESYLNTIANLTLSGNNGPLSNKSFVEKRDMNIEGKEQGYRYSRLWLNRSLASSEQWNSDELEKRFTQIAERFKKIWSYPTIQVEREDGENNNETNIFEAADPTYKRLEYVIFFDQKLPITRVSELYVHVMRTLFELQPDTFFKTDLGEKVSLTTDKEHLRQPAQVDDLYYIETHYNNVDKFERMKLALSLFDVEDDLLIKYAED
ncbi:MAG: HNH endonuclease family protein, partial [Acidobacteriota bacterium]